MTNDCIGCSEKIFLDYKIHDLQEALVEIIDANFLKDYDESIIEIPGINKERTEEIRILYSNASMYIKGNK